MAKTTKAEIAPATPDKKDEKSTVSFNFPEKAKVQPENFSGLSIDEEATITVKGKLRNLSISEWDKSKSIGLDLTSCTIEIPKETPMSLEAGLDYANSQRKKV
jgi:hypothetical protein